MTNHVARQTRQRGDDDPGAVPGQEHEPDILRAHQLRRNSVGLTRRTVGLPEAALDDQRQPEGQQQTVEMIEPGEPAQKHPLDDDAGNADHNRRDDQRRPIPDAEPCQQKPGAERAEHVLRAMREIDDVQQAENDREAEAQHRVERAVDQPDQQLREKQRRRRDRDVQPVRHWSDRVAVPSPAMRERGYHIDRASSHPLTSGHSLPPGRL